MFWKAKIVQKLWEEVKEHDLWNDYWGYFGSEALITCLLLRGDPLGWTCRSGPDGLLCAPAERR